MPRTERAPSFQFYPGDFWSDPAVRGLTFAQVGHYLHLLSMSWLSDTPGIISVNDLPRLSGAGRSWPRHEEAIGRCFDRSEPGVWRQRRMVGERIMQLQRHEAASAGARKANENKASRYAKREDSVSRASTPASASASASALESKQPPVGPPKAPRGARVKIGPVTTISEADVGRAVRLTGVSLEVANHLAERIRLEGPQRGYLNYPSALLNWCRREKDNPITVNGLETTERHEGDRAKGPDGSALVWWHARWRSEKEAKAFGWSP